MRIVTNVDISFQNPYENQSRIMRLNVRSGCVCDDKEKGKKAQENFDVCRRKKYTKACHHHFLWQRAFLVWIPMELKGKRESETEWESLNELIYFKTSLFATFMGWWWNYLEKMREEKNQQGKLLRDGSL